MATVRLQLDLSVPSFAFRGLLTLALLAFGADELVSETVTLTTYYPAPSGVYVNMITTQNTWLARDSATNNGYVNIGSAVAAGNTSTRLIVMNGRVGVGNSNPAAMLDVTGSGNVTTTMGVGGALTVGGTVRVNGSGILNSAGYELVETDATDWTRWNQGSGSTNGNAMYQSLALGTGGLTVGAWENQALGVLKATSRIHLQGVAATTQRGYIHIQNNNTGCAYASRTPNAPSPCGATQYIAWQPGVYAEGWTYDNRGGQVIANKGASNSTQVWALSTVSGNAEWHTLNKNDSVVGYYCCPK